MAAYIKLLTLRIATCIAILSLILICVFIVWWPFAVDLHNFGSANGQLFMLNNLVVVSIGLLVAIGVCRPGRQDKESVARFVKSQLESDSLNGLFKTIIRMTAINRENKRE